MVRFSSMAQALVGRRPRSAGRARHAADHRGGAGGQDQGHARPGILRARSRSRPRPQERQPDRKPEDVKTSRAQSGYRGHFIRTCAKNQCWQAGDLQASRNSACRRRALGPSWRFRQEAHLGRAPDRNAAERVRWRGGCRELCCRHWACRIPRALRGRPHAEAPASGLP